MTRRQAKSLALATVNLWDMMNFRNEVEHQNGINCALDGINRTLDNQDRALDDINRMLDDISRMLDNQDRALGLEQPGHEVGFKTSAKNAWSRMIGAFRSFKIA